MGSFKQLIINAVGVFLIIYTLFILSSYLNIKYDTTGIYMFWFMALMIFYIVLPIKSHVFE
jgi:hypothetical protein